MEKMETLMEERETQMIAPSGGKPCFRIARFLKPSFPISQKLLNPPPISPFITKPTSQIAKSLSSKVNFHGWKNPLKNWTTWVKKLLPTFQSTWKNTSIYEAIMASTYEIPRCRGSVFSIGEKWCSETNTFVLSWGEVTITLEDVLVLGGYSVTGDSVLSEVSSSELGEIKRNLDNVYSEIRSTKAKKVSHYQWMDVWMKTGSEFEHEAFLILWLSKCVLPSKAGGVINRSVFPIAILLSRGTSIALAPAVLASIYRDLRLLKEMIVSLRELGDEDDGSMSKLNLSAPLQLLQVWIWERFTTLSPKPNQMTDGLPRLQRWHKVEISKNENFGLDFDSAIESFRWRPYSARLNNCSFCANLYVEKASWVSVTSEVAIDFETYARIVRNSKLVGLCCVEQYLPHRVSMQFGLDQDIPCDFPRGSDTRKIAWNDYNRPIGDVKLYIPSRLFESDVTARYLEWWKKSGGAEDNADWVRKKEDAELTTKPCQDSSMLSMSVPPGFSRKGKRVVMGDSSDQHQPISKSSGGSLCRPEIVIEISESDVSAGSSSEIKGVKADDDHLTLTKLFGVKSNQKANRNGTLSVNRLESPLTSSAGDDASIQEIRSMKENTANICPREECTRKELVIEDRSESKPGCPVRSPISIDKNETQTTLNVTPESSGMDILDRIARLQRIIDLVKADKLSQA